MRSRKWRQWLVPAGVFLALVIAMCWRLWTPIGDRKEFGIDSQWAYWGELKFTFDALKHGQLPLWNPFDRCGYPFYADPQSAILYPVNWVLLGLGAVAGGLHYWIIDVENAFHLWLAAFGMYVYLRRRGTSPFACYAGGLVLVLSSPFMHHFDLNLNWSMAWAPWLLTAVDAWGERPTPGRAAWMGLAAGMCFLAGAMPTFWYAIVIVGPYAIWSILHHRKSSPDYLRLASVSAAIAVAIFGALIVAQFTATSALVKSTVRNARDLDFIVGTQFNATDLVGFFVPRLTRLNHYIGVGAIFWMFAALSVKPDARKLVLGGLAIFGVLCAWGLDGAILPVVSSLVPPFRLFRYAMRYSYVSMVPIGILAAEGLDLLANVEDRKRAGNLVLLAGALGVAIFGVGFVVNKGNDRLPYGMAFGAFVVGTWATWQVVASGPKKFGPIAVWLLALDLFVAHGDAIERNMAPLVDTHHDPEVASLAGVRSNETRLFDRSYLKFRPGIRLQIRDFGGYEGDPLNLSRYEELKNALESRPSLFGLANVGWILEEAPKLLPNNNGLKPVRGGVYQVPDVAPAVYWTGKTTVVADDKAALGALLGTKPGTAAILEQKTAPPVEPSDAPPVAGAFTTYERNRVVATIDAPAAGVVVVNETFDPAWTATVDGQPAKIFPANELFRGVAVGPGQHTIEMRYHAGGFLALSVLNLLGLAGAAFLIWREREPDAA